MPIRACPANILWIAVLSTQAVATLVALYGAYIMTPLGWSWAAFVWGYALAWFLVNDRLKLLTYRYLDSTTKAVKTPQNEPAQLQVQAFVAAFHSMLAEYRRLIAFGQNI